MTVETPERAWTDPRLDDLTEKVDKWFAAADKKMDAGFEAADKKMDDGFAAVTKKMDAGFEKVDVDIREVRGDMRGLRKELLAAAIVILGVLIKTHGL